MRFWDSSAVVPLIFSQPSTEHLRRRLKEDPLMMVWWGTEVECASALGHVERQKEANLQIISESLIELKMLASIWHQIEPTVEIKEQSMRLLRVHNLRASDALQLAAAIVASEHRPSSLPFVCLNDRLSAVAQREGFSIAS